MKSLISMTVGAMSKSADCVLLSYINQLFLDKYAIEILKFQNALSWWKKYKVFMSCFTPALFPQRIWNMNNCDRKNELHEQVGTLNLWKSSAIYFVSSLTLTLF